MGIFNKKDDNLFDLIFDLDDDKNEFERNTFLNETNLDFDSARLEAIDNGLEYFYHDGKKYSVHDY